MDTTALEVVERELGEVMRTAYGADAALVDPRWPLGTGRVFEDAAGVVDYLRRLLHGFPDDPHYAREKSGALVAAVLQLHHRLMEPALACLAEIVVEVADEDGPYTLERSCALPRGHEGEHDHRGGARSMLIEAADELDERVTLLTRRLRWALAGGYDDPEVLDEIAGELVDLGGQLRGRFERYRAGGADA